MIIHQLSSKPSDGGYILGGESYSDKSGEKTENSRGINDYWIVKLDASGNIQWDQTIGGNKADGLTSLQQISDGGYILAGYSFSDISGEKTENCRGSYDYWILKTNSQGKVLWDKTIGGSSFELCRKIREIKRNDYVVGGLSDSRISGDKTGGNRGGFDYWLVELKYVKRDSTAIASKQTISRLNTPLHNNDALIVYPNPAHDKITIQYNGKAVYTLTNGEGKIAATQTINGNGIMHVANVPAGIYYLKNITTGVTKKVMIIK